MSFSTLPGVDHWLKLQPNPGMQRQASQTAIAVMESLGYKHHDHFVTTNTNPTRRTMCIGSGTERMHIRDDLDRCITIQGSLSSLNLLFTKLPPNRKSARTKGVKKENEFVTCLRSGEPFDGKEQLETLCGEITPDSVQATGNEKINRHLEVTNNDLYLTVKDVRDAYVNGYSVSYKVGPEVRLISTGVRNDTHGFVDYPTKLGDTNRCRILQAIGINPGTYNLYYGYENAITNQSLIAERLIEQAFGRCIYFHNLQNGTILVNDFINNRPEVRLLDEGTVRGFNKPGNRNIEIYYDAKINGKNSLATFMLRSDNGSYKCPNNLQIKIRYR